MARFIDPTRTKFWEIERDGATIIRRSGKLGQTGRTQTTTFASPVHARYEHGSMVGRKTFTEKYTPESPPSPNPADDFPADDEGRLVHADLLQSRGDALGELIMLQHANHHDAQKLIDAHAEWFGDLANARGLFDWHWRLGRLSRVRLDPEDVVDWKIQLARLLPDVPLCYRLGALLDALFDLEIARSLEELEVSTAGTLDMQDTMKTIVEHAPPTLRRLELRRSRGPNVQAEQGAWLYAMKFPALEEFACWIDLSDAAIKHVVDAEWPKLHTLSFAMNGYTNAPTSVPDTARGIAELAPLFEKPGALRNLEIKTASPSALVNAMLRHGALAKLDELVIRSKRPIDRATETALNQFNPNARYIQMPAYSMRPG